MADKILFKRSSNTGVTPTVSDLLLGEIALNIYDGKIFTRRRYEVEGDPVDEIVQFVSKVPVGNTFYVSVNGDDVNNDGTTWERAFATIEKAMEAVALRNGIPTLIDIGPGTYYTQGHIDMPDNCAIRSVHRTVFIRPVAGYEQRNVFRMGSGCFVEGLMIEGFEVDDFDDPTEGFAFSFRPGAVIVRTPYAHKCAIRRIPTWDYIAPPLDRDNGNPLVGRGGGVVLADGAVCSPYSIFPNIMTWGATPVTQNGIGYCAKNGALINAVNAVSIWAHKHFYALSGGQIILSSCSTQFGDYTMISKGTRQLVSPTEVENTSVIDPQAPANAVLPQAVSYTASGSLEVASGDIVIGVKQSIIDNMWTELVNNNYVTGWTQEQEDFTKRDAGNLIEAIVGTLRTGDSKYVENFARGLLLYDGTSVFSPAVVDAVLASYGYLETEINTLPGMTSGAQTIVSSSFTLVSDMVSTPATSNIVIGIEDALVVDASKTTIINDMWTALVNGGYTAGWTPQDEEFTKRDSGLLIQALAGYLHTGDKSYIDSFRWGMFDSFGYTVIDSDKLDAFEFGFNYIDTALNALAISVNSKTTISTEISGIIADAITSTPLTSTPALQVLAGNEIVTASTTLVNNMWTALVDNDYVELWTAEEEQLTKRDATNLLNTIARTLQTGNENYLRTFIRGLFYLDGTSVIEPSKKSAFLFAYDYLNTNINLLSIDNSVKTVVDKIFDALVATVEYPVLLQTAFTTQTDAASAITAAQQDIIDGMWYQLYREGLAAGWSNELEAFTRRDAATLLLAITRALENADQTYIINFVKSLYYANGTAVFPSNQLEAFLFCYRYIRNYVYSIPGVSRSAATMVDEFLTSVEFTLRYPSFVTTLLSQQSSDATTIFAARQAIIDSMWNALVNGGYTTGWTAQDEAYTRRDAGNLIQVLTWVLQSANEKPALDFAKGFFDTNGVSVIDADKLSAFIFSWNTMRDDINALNINNTTRDIISSLIAALIYTAKNPSFTVQPSVITAIGHTWTAVLAGVALTKIPPVLNQATIQDSILELDQGIVIASGQDDQGSALFVGGMQINADTGELSGPPFDTAVNRIATKTAISRSF